MSEMEQFYDENIYQLVDIAKSDGWDAMVRYALTIVEKFTNYKDQAEKFSMAKVLINDVGYELTKK